LLFEYCRRGGVGCRHNPRPDTHPLGNFLEAEGFVFFDDAAGLVVLVFVADLFRGEVVFNHLLFHNAHAGFFSGHLGHF
jgi:hypothetical protein